MTEGGAWGPLLRKYRERSGLSVKNVALRVFLSPSSLTVYESGKERPSASRLEALGNALHCTPEETAGLLATLPAAPNVTSDVEPLDAQEDVHGETEKEDVAMPAKAKRPTKTVRCELVRCEACGMAYQILRTNLTVPGYAAASMEQVEQFVKAHVLHGEVTVARLAWPKATVHE